MTDATTESFPFPRSPDPASDDPLTAILRQGARRLLSQAVEAEVEQWIAEHAHLLDEHGHRQVVRNGHAQLRHVVTGLGPVEVKMPRVQPAASRWWIPIDEASSAQCPAPTSFVA